MSVKYFFVIVLFLQTFFCKWISNFFCILIDRSLFQIFRRFFLRKVWLLIIVTYVSESRKLPVPSHNFGLGACPSHNFGLAALLSRHRKLKNLFSFFELKAKWWKQLLTIVFLEELLKQHFQSKLISVTLRNSEWWLVTSSDLENTLLGLRSKPRHKTY